MFSLSLTYSFLLWTQWSSGRIGSTPTAVVKKVSGEDHGPVSVGSIYFNPRYGKEPGVEVFDHKKTNSSLPKIQVRLTKRLII